MEFYTGKINPTPPWAVFQEEIDQFGELCKFIEQSTNQKVYAHYGCYALDHPNNPYANKMMCLTQKSKGEYVVNCYIDWFTDVQHIKRKDKRIAKFDDFFTWDSLL